MTNVIKIKRGLNIDIAGAPAPVLASMNQSTLVAISPDDFNGIVPKVLVKEGETVKAGTPIFLDKKHPELKIVAPVSGTIEEVARGERRKLLYISIRRDVVVDYENFEKLNLEASREELHKAILNAGFGAFIKQRPYDVVANPDFAPKAIFVSAFDSAPLAPDSNFVVKGQGSELQAGLKLLAKLTDGKVYFSIAKNAAPELKMMQGVEINVFDGAHPAGNVGIQINKLNPINKGEVVWTMNLQDVIALGRFVNKGIVDFTKFVALTGPEVYSPCYFKTIVGTNIQPMVAGNVYKENKLRYISGNVLSGTKVCENGYLRAFDSQITVIQEGDEADELIGWLTPRFNKFSASLSYPWQRFAKFCKCKFDFDARVLGGRRAIIMSGEYDKVFPMDIMPEQLIKAMIAKNLEQMEALGAYEVAPEDFALCEFVCTSKMELQSIVREALDYMRKELE